eukprot:scaffold116464_cov63-Phaeocystis_antarctica.AAC.1
MPSDSKRCLSAAAVVVGATRSTVHSPVPASLTESAKAALITKKSRLLRVDELGACTHTSYNTHVHRQMGMHICVHIAQLWIPRPLFDFASPSRRQENASGKCCSPLEHAEWVGGDGSPSPPRAAVE